MSSPPPPSPSPSPSLSHSRLSHIRSLITSSGLEGHPEDLLRLESEIGLGFRRWLVGTKAGREGLAGVLGEIRGGRKGEGCGGEGGKMEE